MFWGGGGGVLCTYISQQGVCDGSVKNRGVEFLAKRDPIWAKRDPIRAKSMKKRAKVL